jgi:uncharacterized membrane protein YkoI
MMPKLLIYGRLRTKYKVKVKHRIFIPGALALAIGLLALAGCTSARQQEAALLAQARIGKDQAARAALAHTPGGRIKDAELDNDDGKLVWWFDISTPGAKDVTEINVDAITGGVISVTTEIPDQP